MRASLVVVLFTAMAISGTRPVHSQPTASRPVTLASRDSTVLAELRSSRRSLDLLTASVDSLRRGGKSPVEVWGPVLVGLAAAMSGFAAAAYASRRSAQSAREGRLEAHLYDALKWFEGETQKRSVGLSVIEGNWKSTALHPTWRGVLVNQAVYLLASSKADTEHERQNLRRMRELLGRLGLDSFDRGAIKMALEKRKDAGGGVPNVDLGPWDQLSAP
jgi:hypothetical protein